MTRMFRENLGPGPPEGPPGPCMGPDVDVWAQAAPRVEIDRGFCPACPDGGRRAFSCVGRASTEGPGVFPAGFRLDGRPPGWVR